ncbi:hypothetical protein P9112_006738 [Eukaryota sp. TZLM1-RC]
MADEYDLPKAVITRIIKSQIPQGTSVAKDASLAINHATTTFISFITDLATKHAKKSKRSTLTADDFVAALCDADFVDFADAARNFHLEYKERLKAEKLQSSGTTAPNSEEPKTQMEAPTPHQPEIVDIDTDH